jgi:hypothetical protein
MSAAASVDEARAIIAAHEDAIYDAVPAVRDLLLDGKADWWEYLTLLDAATGTLSSIVWFRKRSDSSNKRLVVPAFRSLWSAFVNQGDRILCHLFVNRVGGVMAAIVFEAGKDREPYIAVLPLVDDKDGSSFLKSMGEFAGSLQSVVPDQTTLNGLLDMLGNRLMPTLEKIGVSGKHLVLVPQGVMNYIPLHAIHATINGRPTFLVEQFRSISYIHTVHELFFQSEWFYEPTPSAEEPRGKHLAIIDGSASDLPWLELEEHVAHLLGAAGASIEVVQDPSDLPKRYDSYEFLSWSSHAFSSVRSWADSSLSLADHRITATEILDSWELRAFPKVILSACETGADFSVHDPIHEYCGLDFAARVAGAGEVVSSMWKVQDVVAAITSSVLTDWHYTQPKLTAGEGLAHIQRAMLRGSWKDLLPNPEQLRQLRSRQATPLSPETLDQREALWATLSSVPDDALRGVGFWGVFKCAGFPLQSGMADSFAAIIDD